MNITRYEPWSLFNQLSQLATDLNRSYESRDGSDVSTSDWTPAVDIREEKDHFVLHADVPGVDPKAIEINMENGILSISGTREKEAVEEGKNYKRVERVRGSFMRRFTLPDYADAERISARSTNGVLEIVIPKHEKVKPRKIEVKH